MNYAAVAGFIYYLFSQLDLSSLLQMANSPRAYQIVSVHSFLEMRFPTFQSFFVTLQNHCPTIWHIENTQKAWNSKAKNGYYPC